MLFVDPIDNVQQPRHDPSKVFADLCELISRKLCLKRCQMLVERSIDSNGKKTSCLGQFFVHDDT
ncbi:hypothetical protein PSMEN_07185 [Ectopseudomonas mendocina]|nr:hypothetical protein PSMEN_07185 [Pseudomonas mendocina]